MGSWNGHIPHVLAETVYPAAFGQMCFTETTSHGTNFRDIDSYEINGKSFHKFTGHDFVICYQTSKIPFVE